MASDNRIPDHQPPPGELPLCQPVLRHAQATPLHERKWISEDPQNAKRRRHEFDEGSAIQDLVDHHNYVYPNGEFSSSAGVIFKRSREGRIPIVFHPVDTSISFWRINSNCLAQNIVSAAQEKVLSQRINKDGTLNISVASVAVAKNLLKVK